MPNINVSNKRVDVKGLELLQDQIACSINYAKRNKMEFLVYLLEMAQLESRMQIEKVKNSKSNEDSRQDGELPPSLSVGAS